MTYGDRTRGETTKADGVYLEMRNQILYGVLEPGSRVDYLQLSAALGVSITPLREALRRLEADHLVIRIAHRDVIVAPLTREEATELVQVRRELDLLAARLAAAQMTADELAAARDLVESQDEREALRYLRDAGIPVAVGRDAERQPGVSPDGLLRIAQPGADSVPGRHIDQDRAVRDPGPPDQRGRARGLPADALEAADGAGGARRGGRRGGDAGPLPGTGPRLRRRDLRPGPGGADRRIGAVSRRRRATASRPVRPRSPRAAA